MGDPLALSAVVAGHCFFSATNGFRKRSGRSSTVGDSRPAGSGVGAIPGAVHVGWPPADGEPKVCSPADALTLLYGRGLEHLLMGRCYVTQKVG